MEREEKHEKTEVGPITKKDTAERPSRVITGVIRAPHVTEKASGMAEDNKYVFLVNKRANKPEILQAIEARYGVKVDALNVINTHGKERRRGRQIGWKAGFKKAIVKIEQGQTIEIQ